MIWLSVITTLILSALGVLHLMWAFEVWWPIRDERRLVASVVGFTSAERMPGAIPCGSVVACLIAMVALIWMPDSSVRYLGLWMAGTVLVLRGALAYVPAWRRMTPQQPFARNDQMFYGPLCLGLGGALLVLA